MCLLATNCLEHINLAQSLGGALDGVEHRGAEGRDQTCGVDGLHCVSSPQVPTGSIFERAEIAAGSHVD